MTFDETRADLRLDMLEKNTVRLTMMTGKIIFGTVTDIIGDKFELTDDSGKTVKECISAIDFYYLD